VTIRPLTGADLDDALGGLFALPHTDWRPGRERAVRAVCVAVRLDEAERSPSARAIAPAWAAYEKSGLTALPLVRYFPAL
jgi:hypothetical protein